MWPSAKLFHTHSSLGCYGFNWQEDKPQDPRLGEKEKLEMSPANVSCETLFQKYLFAIDFSAELWRKSLKGNFKMEYLWNSGKSQTITPSRNPACICKTKTDWLKWSDKPKKPSMKFKVKLEKKILETQSCQKVSSEIHLYIYSALQSLIIFHLFI